MSLNGISSQVQQPSLLQGPSSTSSVEDGAALGEATSSAQSSAGEPVGDVTMQQMAQLLLQILQMMAHSWGSMAAGPSGLTTSTTVGQTPSAGTGQSASASGELPPGAGINADGSGYKINPDGSVTFVNPNDPALYGNYGLPASKVQPDYPPNGGTVVKDSSQYGGKITIGSIKLGNTTFQTQTLSAAQFKSMPLSYWQTITASPAQKFAHFQTLDDAQKEDFYNMPGNHAFSQSLIYSGQTPPDGDSTWNQWINNTDYGTNAGEIDPANGGTTMQSGGWYNNVYITPTELASNPSGSNSGGFAQRDLALSGATSQSGAMSGAASGA